jgi:hypothetical protein
MHTFADARKAPSVDNRPSQYVRTLGMTKEDFIGPSAMKFDALGSA